MGIVVDTSVLVAAERQRFDLDGLLATAGEGTAAIAAITASELLHGVERAREPLVRAERLRNAEDVFDSFAVIPFGLAEARIHASIWAALAAKGGGRMIGAHDLLVAATAIAIGAAVATLNQKDFKRIRGLTLAPIAKFVKG